MGRKTEAVLKTILSPVYPLLYRKKEKYYHIPFEGDILRIASPSWDRKASTNSCWLILGKEKALLIDAGEPGTGLRVYAQKLVDGRKLLLALTHGHYDHTGAINDFDAVYLNRDDRYLLDGILGLPRTPFHGKCLDLNDGDCIDLGGREIHCYQIPGHTPGSVCFLDMQTKILFSGDSVARRGFYTEMDKTSVSVHFDVLLRFEKLPFERLATAHDPDLLPKGLIRRYITVMLEHIHTPNGHFALPGIRFNSINVGKDVNDPDYLTISYPKKHQAEIAADLDAWKVRNAEWLGSWYSDRTVLTQ